MPDVFQNILIRIAEIIFEPISALIVVALSALGAWLFNIVIPIFIKARATRDIEFLKRDLLRKDKTESVTRCIVLLQKQRFDELTDEEKDELDELFLMLCLHLPACLVHKLAHTACHTGSEEDLNPYGLLVEVRKFIDGTYKEDKSES